MQDITFLLIYPGFGCVSLVKSLISLGVQIQGPGQDDHHQLFGRTVPYSPREADLALAFLIAIACSLASAAASASPRAPATLRYLARLRAAISSASSICFL